MKVVGCKVKNCRKAQTGLAAVEFVIVMLMLVPMIVATVEVGRYMYQYNTLTKAVRDGARYAGDNALNSSGVINILGTITETETQNLVAFGNIVEANGTAILVGIDPNDVSVTAIDVPGLSAGSISPSHIRVSADYDFSPIFNLFSNFIPVVKMTASTVQRAI